MDYEMLHKHVTETTTVFRTMAAERTCPDLVPAWRACVDAVAARKNILIVAPIGSMVVMLARRCAQLLPQWDDATERFEANLLHWGASMLDGVQPPDRFGASEWRYWSSRAGNDTANGGLTARPFRAPHHTVSEMGLIGGADPRPRPGEASLAHGGTLLLDEITEFRKSALEALGFVLRHGMATTYRRGEYTHFPARPRLVISTMHACPCGSRWSLATRETCRCTAEQIERHFARAPVFGATATITIGDQ